MNDKQNKFDQVDDLKSLGTSGVKYDFKEPSVHILETFPNQFPHREYMDRFVFPEFTSYCPKTGQPDFATIFIHYIPDKKCVESKSLKLYFFSYRNHGSFMETITNTILKHLVEIVDPKWMRVVGRFTPRGATHLHVIAEHINPGYELPEFVRFSINEMEI